MDHASRHPSAHRPGDSRRDRLPVTIDCGTCVMRATTTCNDCMVTYLCDREADDAVVFDLVEYRAVRLLSEAGLLPSLQHREATPSAESASG